MYVDILKIYYAIYLIWEGGCDLKKYIYIGAFGFCGAILRFCIKNMKFHWYTGHVPVNTLIINVTGSFFLGFIFALILRGYNMDEKWRLGLTTGLMGTYTTFSSLCKEEVNLFIKGEYHTFFMYIFLSVFLGILSIWIADRLSHLMNKKFSKE